MAAIELGAPYTVLTPDGTDWFDLNDLTSAKSVGRVTDVTGLDAAEIRENAQEIPAGDGGTNLAFYRGRRPWTISGLIAPQFPVLSRADAQERIELVMSQALRSDGYLIWTPSDGIPKYIPFRTQQPTRSTIGQSNADRRFIIAGVAEEWRILRYDLSSATAVGASGHVDVAVTSLGKIVASPRFEWTGPITVPYTITNLTTGKAIHINQPGTTETGHQGIIDLMGQYPWYQFDSSDYYGSIDPLTTDWSIAVIPGAQTFRLSAAGGITSNTHFTVKWRDSWP
jgi:hypothetical protein